MVSFGLVRSCVLLVAAAFVSGARAADPAPVYSISTYAGQAKASADATRVETIRMSLPNVHWSETAGLLATDGYDGVVRRFDLVTGEISTFAQLGNAPGIDVFGVVQITSDPNGFVADANGNLFISYAHCIYSLDRNGGLTIAAGSPSVPGSIDGSAATARFRLPAGLAFNAARTRLYIADSLNQQIRVLDLPSGIVSTIAGRATENGFTDGVGTDVRFRNPYALAIIREDELLVADLFNHAIRRVVISSGTVTVFAGSASGESGALDGVGTAARFDRPIGVATDADGTVYIADSSNAAIRRLDPDTARVTTIAGSLAHPGYVDDSVSSARFNGPSSVALDRATPQIYVGDIYNAVIRRIDLTAAKVTTVAGVFVGRNGPLVLSRFTPMNGVAVDHKGSVFVTDVFSATLRQISTDGNVSTIAGQPYVAGWVDGPRDTSLLSGLNAVVCDALGNIYVSCLNGIRRIAPDGNVTTIAGAIKAGSSDGPATLARFDGPAGIALDSEGNLLIADQRNCTIRRLSREGLVTTVAGVPGQSAAIDGPAGIARFLSPGDLAIDSQGMMYVTDAHTIRRVTPDGTVTTIAGAPMVLGFRDGDGSDAQFNFPYGLAIDRDGSILVADSTNRVLRRVTQSGHVTTIAGQPGIAGDDDGPNGRFRRPTTVALAADGTIVVGDWGNATIRVVTATPNTRLTNLAVRTVTGPGEQTLISGFAVTGSASKQLVIRAVGPTLADFGVMDAVSNPTLRVFSGPTLIAESSASSDVPAATFATVGAFPLRPLDAASSLQLAPGSYTAHAATHGETGTALLEVYDADPLTHPARLSNLSVRGKTGGGVTLIAGFALRGYANRSVLIRGLGPGLRALGIVGVVQTPMLVLYAADGTVLARYGEWSAQANASAIGAAAKSVGALVLSPNSSDAACLTILRPGNYTVELRSTDGSAGIGVIELFELP